MYIEYVLYCTAGGLKLATQGTALLLLTCRSLSPTHVCHMLYMTTINPLLMCLCMLIDKSIAAFVWRILFSEEAFMKCSNSFFFQRIQDILFWKHSKAFFAFVSYRMHRSCDICISLYTCFFWNCLSIPESEGPKQMGLISFTGNRCIDLHQAQKLIIWG